MHFPWLLALLLALTVLESSRVAAFTIRRATESTHQPDLVAAESHLEVKNDLSRLKYTTLPVGSTLSLSSEDVITTNHVPRATVQTTNTAVTINEITTSQATESQSTAETSSQTTFETSPTTEVESYSEKATVEDIDLGTSTEPEKSSSQVTKNVSLAYMNNTVKDNTSSTTTTTQNEISFSEKTQNDVETTVPSKEIQAELKTEVSNAVSYSTETVNYGTTTPDMSSSTTIDGSDTNDKSTTTEVVSPTFTTTTKQNEASQDTNTITNEVTTELKTSEKLTEGLTEADTIVTAVPYWKKYTVIDRKRLSTLYDAFTSTEHDLLKSGTAQTANIEKAIHIPSGIPSLDQLSNELLNKGTTTSLDQSKFSETTTAANEIIKTDATLAPTTDGGAEITKTDIVSSKRAGFLDFSARPTVGTEPAIVQKNDNPIEVPINGISNTPIIGTSPKSLETLKSSSMASQSQLAEDAINEELMKEEILSANKDAQRQRQDSLIIKAQNTETKVELTPTVDTSVEDKLSVKPISSKSPGSRYTVSPNYKPLKKLEIQPPKAFVRNPDDNSWRNESLSSLGIVFKANNSSKPFTEVLKNKTETELNTSLGLNSKEDTLELRVRLEKIAEQRKSKKKKINQYGETVYTDYEESVSAENLSTTKKPDETPIVFAPITPPKETPDVETNPPGKQQSTLFNFDILKTEAEVTTTKSKKVVVDYDAEEDEPDYTLANIDLKKFNAPAKKPEPPASIPPPPSYMFTTPPTTRTYTPERKPTIQYFPPREKPKVAVQDYDTDFQRKINAYTYTPPRITQTIPTTVTTQSSFVFPKNKFETPQRPNDIRQPEDLSKNIYLTQAIPLDQGPYLVPQDISFNRGSYVIKHLRDFINEVVKADENPNFAVTEVPVQGVTSNQGIKENSVKPPADYYDYEAQFKKDVLDRFVENFNQNSDRFKADFPILYNTTVVHNKLADAGNQASSSAFMKRLYDDARAIQHAGKIPKRYDPNCDRTVELSPAYELHYYVPEEEEKEEFQPKAATLVPYTFRI